VTAFWLQAAGIIVGALYLASVPFSGWLVWEAHRIRRDARSDVIR